MRLPRLTTRRLMVIVAVVACLIEAERIRQHWSYCTRQAQQHANQADAYRHMRETAHARMSPDQFQALVGTFDRLEADYLAAQRKWEEAARRPWLPLPPDPSEPW